MNTVHLSYKFLITYKSSMEESLSSWYLTFSKPDSMNFERFLEWNREATTKEWAF